MEKEIICTVCPMGCHITVTGEGDRVDSITGYTCKRGEEYGKQEFAHPVRILTSTVKLEGRSAASSGTLRKTGSEGAACGLYESVKSSGCESTGEEI